MLPDFTSQDPASYKASIDKSIVDLLPRYGTMESLPNELNLGATLASPRVTALDDNACVLFDLTTRDLQKYVFNKTLGWLVSGNALTLTGVSCDIAALSATEIALVDTTSDQLRKYTFDGSDWSLTGTAFSLPAITSLFSLVALSDDTVVLYNLIDFKLYTYTYSGTTWSQTGNALTILTGVVNPSLCAMSSTSIAFHTTGLDTLQMYTWDGSDWTAYGNTVSVVAGDKCAMSALNEHDVVFANNTDDEVYVYRFFGEDWEVVSVVNVIGGTPAGVSISALSFNSFVSIDSGTRDLRKYEFYTTAGKGPRLSNSDYAGIPTLANFRARRNNTGSQSIPNSAFTTIIFDEQFTDSTNSYDHTTGIFTAPKSGNYVFSVCASVSNSYNINDVIQMIMIGPSGNEVGGDAFQADRTASLNAVLSGSACLYLGEGQTFHAQIIHVTGSAKNVNGGDYTYITGVQVG